VHIESRSVSLLGPVSRCLVVTSAALAVRSDRCESPIGGVYAHPNGADTPLCGGLWQTLTRSPTFPSRYVVRESRNDVARMPGRGPGTAILPGARLVTAAFRFEGDTRWVEEYARLASP